MASFWKKITSGLDFWDVDENRRQREQFAREDREEEERRKREQAARSSVVQNRPQPGEVITPFAPPKAPVVAGSQSDLNELLFKPMKAQPNPVIKAPVLTPEQKEANRKKAELEALTQQNLEKAREDAKRGESWIGRNILNRKAIEERAIAQARNRATQQFQDKYGWTADPTVLEYGKGTSARLQKESERLAKGAESLDNFEDKMVKGAQIMSYVPVAGSVFNLGLAGTEKLAKATGNEAYGNDIAEQRLRVDLDMTQEEFDQLDEETKGKLRLMQNVGLAASPLDFLGLGGLAKSGITTVGKKAIMEAVQTHGLKKATQKALTKTGTEVVKRGTVPAIAGTGISLGGQQYLTGEMDPFEAAKSGLLVGGTSLLFPSQGIRNAADDAATSSLSNLKKATAEAEKIPGTIIEDVGNVETPKVDVADGVKTEANIESLREQASDVNAPAYQRKQAKEDLRVAEEELTNANAEALGAGEAPTDRPAYQHKRELEDVVSQGQRELDDFLDANPNASMLEIENARNSINTQVLARIEAIQAARYGDAAVNVPSPTDPMALAKGGTTTGAVNESTPIADFTKAVDAPLQKASDRVPVKAPAVAAATAGDVDATGNRALTTDAQVADEMMAAGVAPTPAPSIVDTTEGAIENAAERTARQQVNNEEISRVRQTIADTLDDPMLREDVLTDFESPQRINIEETKNSAKATLNQLDDDQIIGAYQKGAEIRNAEDYYEAVGAIRRIQRINTPEAKNAVGNIMDGLDAYKTKGGQTLRVVRTLYEDMPAAMKADYLAKKLARAGVELSDADRAVLDTFIMRADDAADNLRNLEDQARALLESGQINPSMTPEVRAQITQLTRAIDEARNVKEIRAGEAWRQYQQHVPPTELGKRAADVGRTMMLSAPTGRGFDIISTSMTTADDLLTRGVSNLIGKGVNLAKAGTVQDTVSAPTKLFKGLKEGARRIVQSAKGQDHVEDFMGEARRATRGDINTGGSFLRRGVRTMVEAPTNLTRGLREEQLFREGMQEAAQVGLKGSERQAYAELRAAVPTPKQLEAAVETHMKANMLHNNKVSRFLNGIAQSLDRSGHGAGAVFIRNQVMPFTSWVGGNLHRTLTDKNVLHNAAKIVDGARKGDAQMIVDNVSKLAVNTGQAYAVGMLLTKAGVITTEDANGDDYGGLYFHIGDRYFPVAIAGTVSVPLILGNAIQQGMDAQESGEGDFTGTFVNTVVGNGVKNAGVASVFGGENNLQSTVDALSKGEDVITAAAKFGGDMVRQYIPAINADANALLDSTQMNPTGEAAKTKVTYENPETGREKTDVVQTELNKTMAKIPFVAQGMEREEGKPAKDIVDRLLKGNRETGEMVVEREAAQEKQDRKAYLKEIGADTAEGIEARAEEGDFDAAIEGTRFRMEELEADKKLSKSKKQDMETDIRRLEITRDAGYPAEIMKAYESIGVEEWREMGDPDSELYDPETYELLAQYDEHLKEAGVSRKSNGKANKYYQKGGGSGGKGGKKAKFITSIATNNFNEGGIFSPIKAQAATYGARESAVPVIDPVPNYDTSKLKKISVKRGGRS